MSGNAGEESELYSCVDVVSGHCVRGIKSLLGFSRYHVSKASIKRGISTTRAFLDSVPPRPAPGSPPPGLRARLQKLNHRLPALLRSYTTPLIGAPTTHITSFLILHEITAVVPLFSLFALFHYTDWTPLNFAGGDNTSLNEAIQRFGKWMTKKGWVDSEDVEAAQNFSTVSAAASTEEGNTSQVLVQHKGAQLVLQFAAAYVATKALLPVRIIASVWATPWFAQALVGPIGRGLTGLLRRP